MLSINTNLSSLIAQSSMKTSSQLLNQAVERMSTGYKINHAKDNAANYSISTNMTTKMGALQVAEDNALQGLEMMSSTSENLSLIEEKLVRMRALAVQAQSGTYGTKSLNALSAEADSLLNEINRINESATYNGIKLFSTGKDNSVTNAGKELELNEQGFLQEVVKVDTTGMTALSSMADDATLAVGEYTISSKEELVQLQEMATAGLVTAGSTFVLTDNVDLSGLTWKSISCSCNFNGNGYTIKNLTGSNGLFSTTTLVENLRLENINIDSSAYNVGGIATAGTTARNCVVTGRIKSRGSVTGGIEGSSGNVTYCYADVEISATKGKVGGIAGWLNYTYASHCVSTGKISSESGEVGGISGDGGGSYCASYATISGTTNVGGISGTTNSGISNSYFAGSVSGTQNVGGLIGKYRQFDYKHSNNIIEGSVSGNSDVGVFIGYSEKESSLKNCYYYSKMSGKNTLFGENSLYKDLEVVDITIPTDYTLQIASSGDDATSTISCTTFIDFGGLKDLLSSGLESSSSIEKIDNLISIASLKQAELGMMEQRLYSVLDEISIQYENIVSSRSTILDADIADVSSTYIQQQILQQAAATLMSTANQSPAIALQLI